MTGVIQSLIGTPTKGLQRASPKAAVHSLAPPVVGRKPFTQEATQERDVFKFSVINVREKVNTLLQAQFKYL